MTDDNEEPVARITLTTIYTEVVKLTGIPSQVKDHEVRIRAIEKYLWIWIGAAGVIGAGAAQLVSYLINSHN
jgi:hypothetical protein